MREVGVPGIFLKKMQGSLLGRAKMGGKTYRRAKPREHGPVETIFGLSLRVPVSEGKAPRSMRAVSRDQIP